MTTITSATQESLGGVLQRITESLDIPDELHDDAVLKYEGVGEWLAAEDSELFKYEPKIFPQGSFRLGTVVRPINRSGAYDIDLVCQLGIPKEATTQKELKAKVGRRLKLSTELAKITTPSRRCWTLDWSLLFHMDVLPSIPNREAPPTGILLTDTELVLWQKSNPIRYAEWFKERMRTVLLEKLAALAKSRGADVADVPEWQVKTPLQRAVQVLKRHRDVAFATEESNRPVSIIITTLAAQAYKNQTDVVDALISIAEEMPRYIRNEGGKYIVENPAEPGENFADKWNEDPKRRDAFFRWLAAVRSDFGALSHASDLKKSYPLLERSLGRDVTASAIGVVEERLQKSGALAPALVPVPKLDDARHAQQPLWRIADTHSARLKGAVYRKQGGKWLWDLADRPVPKHLSLWFDLRTNVPQPFDVYWQVVNTGAEARSESGLRGKIFRDGVGRWESTLYRGTHWIEAFVVKNGVCVARTGRRYVKIL